MTTERYKIVRHFNPAKHPNRDREVIKTGLTLAEAKKHCKDPATHKELDWFDGFTGEQNASS